CLSRVISTNALDRKRPRFSSYLASAVMPELYRPGSRQANWWRGHCQHTNFSALAPMSRWLPRFFPRSRRGRPGRCRIGMFRIGESKEGVLGPAFCIVPGPHLLTAFDAPVGSAVRNSGVVPMDPIHGTARAAFLHFSCGIHDIFPVVRSVRKTVRAL